MLFSTMKRLIKSTPVVRRNVTRLSYEALSRFYDDPRLVVMNYGYASLDGVGRTLDLAPEDEWNRFPLQLYHQAASGVELLGRQVLEIGCGRGGGAEFVARTMGPELVVGSDISGSAVTFARKRHGPTANLRYAQADAEALPFDAGSYDAVINVESSHCYGHMDRFLAEVDRVLAPGGHLLFADLRDAEDAPTLEAALRSARGMTPMHLEDITANVAAALDHTAAQKETLLSTMPGPLRGLFRDQSGHPDGAMYRAFAAGQRVYLRAVLQKEAS